jgi:uncharacterized protein with FMN-binding domain
MKRRWIALPFVLAALALGGIVHAEAPEVYADGSYEVQYKDAELGSVDISITVAGGKLAAVDLPSGRGDVKMDDATLAEWVAELVKASDYLGVDAISGATQSCDLIRYAVQAALQKAALK